MRRPWVWVQVTIGWVPVWALYAMLVATQHGEPFGHAALLALQSVVPAALLGVGVYRFAQRVPWPQPFRLWFLGVHLLAAVVYGVLWIAGSSIVPSIISGQVMIVVGPGIIPFLTLGVWLYLIVAGVAYAAEAQDRAVRADAEATRARLQALRAQLHPHFVFNALHTVIQLIPVDPNRAADAAESVAHVLRTTIEEDRDLVALGEEWAFVERYLAIERLRYGDRLAVQVTMDDAARGCLVPTFSLQTLVENAVRHGAGPRTETTHITITARVAEDALTVNVRDDGAGATAIEGRPGSGIGRLRARLDALCPGATFGASMGPAGVTVTLVIPQGDG